MIKKIMILILLLFSINIVSASNLTIFQIPSTNSQSTTKYHNLILSDFQVLDNNDRIKEIQITLDNAVPGSENINTGAVFNLSTNFTYTIYNNKFNYLYIIPYQTITHILTFQNYTVFNDSKTSLNVLPSNIIVDIKYNENTGLTTFKEIQGIGFNDSMMYQTSKYFGMPSNEIKINALTKFDAEVTIFFVTKQTEIAVKKNKLSSLSSFIYSVATLKIPFTSIQILGDNETLLNLLSVIDMLFFWITVFITLIIVYPYLILVWTISLGNIYIAYKSNSLREIVFNFQIYYSFIGKKFYEIFVILIQYSIRIINMLIFAISNLLKLIP